MAITTCTLVADGSSDRVLVPLLEKLLDHHCPGPYRLQFAESLPAGLRTLTDRVKEALRLYPCDLLFVHRDAEREAATARVDEIKLALAAVDKLPSSVYVIPVRMTESWLLVDETAIRQAAGNPKGRIDLCLPQINRIESLPDPKAVLFDALRAASELPPQRLRRFNPEQIRHRVSELMNSLSGLRRLPSFQHLEHQIGTCFPR
jgi:hypothetical protein